MKPKPYVPQAGHLIWTNFDATLGSEQGGGRPALVLSPSGLFRASGFVIVCPIAPRARHLRAGVVLPPGLPIEGEVLTSHVRSIDTQARPIRSVAAAVPDAVLADARAKVAALIGL